MKTSLSVVIMLVVAVVFFLVGYAAAPVSGVNPGQAQIGVGSKGNCSEAVSQNAGAESGGYGQQAQTGGYGQQAETGGYH